MKNTLKKIGLATVVAVTASSAHADAIGDAIGTAVTAGQTNYGLVVVGLIGLAALGFGLRMIVGAMR
ncbi:hypothetical protein [Vibrio vulnificus]|uniref:hypothetical protein n=1 Tax=Vibrio vulnificus TaxID=672 RepID=UPI0019D4C91A|nr:hypothetical protein [Vibrio vulnificus]EHH0751451.1 hypothetical protein [Vibrio vulnificus]MBN8092979.1 hypothetical protein [Vibrio vulnificus]HDY7704376.1 hypothetical protein [Vibrio vulnificus]